VALGVALGLFVTALALDALVTGDRVHAGLEVGGVALGGMSRDEAAKSLEARLGKAGAGPISVEWEGRRWSVAPSRLGLKVDAAATAEKAWAYTRKGPPAALPGKRLSLWFRSRPIVPAVSYSSTALNRFLAPIRRLVQQAPLDAGLHIEDGRIVTTKARTGRSIQAKALDDLLGRLLISDGRRGVLPVRSIPPAMDDEGVIEARQAAALLLARPVYLSYKQSKWRIPPARIGGWIAFERRLVTGGSRGGLLLQASLDRRRVKRDVEAIAAQTLIRPRDAVFKVDGEKVTILPSRVGAGIDTERAYRWIRKVTASREYRRVPLLMRPIRPKITTEWAKASGIVRRLATYTTTFDSGATARVNNIHLLASQLNNTFVKPGGVFSFNRTIGPRTAEKGYQEAPAIVGGELVPSVGGGVCQVGTTIFNAVFFSGLEVVERHNHSFYISHYPDGRDATVSWDGPDFRFKNDTPAWVLIKAMWGDGYVTVSLYGGGPKSEVSYRTSEFTNMSDPPMRQTLDASLPAGGIVVDDAGIRGRDVTVWRTVKRNGKIVHEDVFKSHYRPKAGEQRVGPKPPPPKAKPSPSTEPTPAAR